MPTVPTVPTVPTRDRLPSGFEVIELRRYTVQPNERVNFGRAFETYFPEAFQQLGSMIFGQFLERGAGDAPARFTWLRGFHDLAERKSVNHAFYDGPLWREHSGTMNDRLIDHTDVLLLRPVASDRAIPVLPTVDAIHDAGGQRGVVVAHIFAVRPEALGDVLGHLDADLAPLRAPAARANAGVREAGLLVSLDVPNNFPRLPYRTDIPYLVWLGILSDDDALAEHLPRAAAAAAALEGRSVLRAPPELVVLDPTPRSRLRWIRP